ncbi:MAG: prepilin peptidase [Alphaproteobacteria bacterium]|nr:prepilin peptidase [Alphaproteobacteria bacterium]
MIAQLEYFILLCFAALMVWTAVRDFRTFIIPNQICIALLLLYPAYVLTVWHGTNPGMWIAAVVLAVAVFACSISLFAVGAMGGGDVKLLALGALWAGPALILEFFVVTAATGLLLAAVVTLRASIQLAQAEAEGGMTRSTVAAGIAGLRHVPFSKLMIPYGTAIATGGLYVAFQLLVG